MSDPKVGPAARAVLDEILACPAEDLTLVWQSLSADERAMLHPVFVQALQSDDRKSAFPALLREAGIHLMHEHEGLGARAKQIAAMIMPLSDALAERLFAAAGTSLQPAILRALPRKHRHRAKRFASASRITPHANAAWLEICVKRAADLRGVGRVSTSRTGATWEVVPRLIRRMRNLTGGRRWQA